MAAQQRVLELAPLRRRNVRRRERPEAGRDPVDRALLPNYRLDVAPRGQDALSCFLAQPHASPVARHRDHRFEVQTVYARGHCTLGLSSTRSRIVALTVAQRSRAFHISSERSSISVTLVTS